MLILCCQQNNAQHCYVGITVRDLRNLSPCSRDLREKLRVAQLNPPPPALCRTLRCVTVFTITRQQSSCWARGTQSTPSMPLSLLSILMFSLHQRVTLPNGPFPWGFPTKILYTFLIYPMRATYPAYLILELIVSTFGDEYKLWRPSLCCSVHPSVTSSILGPKYSPQHHILAHPRTFTCQARTCIRHVLVTGTYL
jgi:hypothetical protein